MTPTDTFDPEERRRLFEATVLPFLPAVLRSAQRLARDTERAKDLTQETCLRAYRTFENFRQGTNCKAWLLTILYSIFVNEYWKKQREPKTVTIEELDQKFHESVASEGEESVGWSDTQVVAALDALSEELRSTVVLVDVEELTYEEAAEALGRPVGTVRSRLFRARKALFVSLQERARREGYIQASKE